MNQIQKNKFDFNVNKAINARTKGEHINQDIINGVWLSYKLSTTWKNITERFKISNNTLSKIRKGLNGYTPTQEAIDYYEIIKNEKEKLLDNQASFVFDGRLQRLQDKLLSFLDSDRFEEHIDENPAFALKLLDSLHKFTVAERKILTERAKVQTEDANANKEIEVLQEAINAFRGKQE